MALCAERSDGMEVIMIDKNYKFVFVILHYLTYEDTCCCIASIEKYCKGFNYNIIVVDNGSNNSSGEKLTDKYKNNTNIKIIINKENLGFARGNNVGFEYAKKEFNPDFIILANNDTMLINNFFCNEIIKEFETSKFAVLGPKIKLKDNTINPIAYPNIEINTLEKQLKRYKASLWCDKNILLYSLKKTYQTMKNILKRFTNSRIQRNIPEKYDANKRHENILLHGSFLIFSKTYIEKFSGLNNKTFLYREEDLLYKRLKENKMLSVYNPRVVIRHNEDSATNALHKTTRGKSIFVNENRIKSTKILIDEIKGDNNEG